jgi:hypothetical protein
VLWGLGGAADRSILRYLLGLAGALAAMGLSAAKYLFRAALAIKVRHLRGLAIVAAILAAIVVYSGRTFLPEYSVSRLDEMERAIKHIERRLAPPGPGRTDVANPATLLVAVQFVTAAADRSTPFDTALAVAISMTGAHPTVGPLLDELLVDAATGVPSTDELRVELQAKLAGFEKNGSSTDPEAGDSSSFFGLNRFLGLGEPEVSAEHREILQKLSADVASRNMGMAVQRVGKLDGRLREGLEDWRKKAERRVAIDAILSKLRNAAFIDIIEEAS